MPGLVGFGFGAGFASSQLTNIILSEIPHAKSGVAGGTNSTARQVGAALGIATIGALVTAQASVLAGTRAALFFAASVVVIGAFTSMLIPNRRFGQFSAAKPIVSDVANATQST